MCRSSFDEMLAASGSDAAIVVCQDDDETPAFIEEARRRCSPLNWRLRQEVDLLRQQWLTLAYALFHTFYVVMHVFLNLAYYRYEAGPRLDDLGFLLVPVLPSRYEVAAEAPWTLLLFLILSSCCFSFHDSAPPGKLPKPYFVNMGKRFVTCYATGHTLRAVTYLSTVLPGAADHCLPGSKWRAAQPRGVADIFWHQASVTSNCGDLVFSGHMLTILLLTCCSFRYAQPVWRTSARVTNGLRGLCVLLCAAQALLILAARHHYTVDVVVALYTVPLLWSWWERMFPDDLVPNDERIAASVLGRRRRIGRVGPLNTVVAVGPLAAGDALSGKV